VGLQLPAKMVVYAPLGRRFLAKSDSLALLKELTMANYRSTIKSTRPPNQNAVNGKEISNLILLGLPPQERTELFSSLEFVRLKLHQVLYEVGDVIKSLYFFNNGLASVLTAQTDGKIVEVSLIGKEGYVGSPVPFGFKTSALRVVVQGDATGY
jgi:hypothetical protein